MTDKNLYRSFAYFRVDSKFIRCSRYCRWLLLFNSDTSVHIMQTSSKTCINSWLITGCVARVSWRVQELPTLPVHTPDFSGVRVTRSLVWCVMLCRSLFVLFLLAIVLSVPLWVTDSNYPFGIFKLFLIYTFRSRIYFRLKSIFNYDVMMNKNRNRPFAHSRLDSCLRFCMGFTSP